jgi:hypothetical protein
LPENNEKGRPMSKLEMKRLLSAKLREPLTSTRDFVKMLPMIKRLNPTWNRRPRRVEKEQDIDHIVLALARQQRVKRAKEKV